MGKKIISIKAKPKQQMPKTRLKRSISLPLLTFYGLGTILGAGIYVLVGKVAGTSGGYAPISFLVAAILAAFTALSYGELSARFPKSAGEVTYVNEALKRKALSIIVGLLVILSGIVSVATLANGFSGYLKEFIQIPDAITISALILGFGLIAIWGITESLTIASIITILEVGGLILVITIASDSFLELPQKWPELIPEVSFENLSGIFLGAFLAFFAFIGFEDMVNIAEEVKNPKRNLPLGIIIALSTATILYLLVALVATIGLPLEELSSSEAPLATLLKVKGNNFATTISLISLIAIANGILIQIIMASRVLYGMASQKLWPLWPKYFSQVNKKTRTPILATILITLIALILALWFPITTLANTTSFVILCVFVLVNLSLWIVKTRSPRPEGVPHYPIWIPITGFFLSLFFLIFKTATTFLNF
jgi:APA family basic amino acid/polyamine antiporter